MPNEVNGPITVEHQEATRQAGRLQAVREPNANKTNANDKTERQIGRKAAGAFVAGVALLGGVLVYVGINNGNGEGENIVAGDDSDESTTTAEPSIDEAGLRDLLTVGDVGEYCVGIVDTDSLIQFTNSQNEEVTLVLPNIGAKKPVDVNITDGSHRLWSDAISTPLQGDETDTPALFKNFEASVCRDTLVTAMAAEYFANMKVGDVNVVDLNAFLQPYKVDADQINDKAAELTTIGANENIDTVIEKNQKQQDLAEHVIELFKRFQLADAITEGKTTFNFHLKAGGLQVEGLPEIEVNPLQYTGKFLSFRLTLKGQDNCLKEVLVNIQDQRIAETELCAPPVITTQEHPTTTQPNRRTRRSTTTTILPTTTTVHNGRTTTTTRQATTTTTTGGFTPAETTTTYPPRPGGTNPPGEIITTVPADPEHGPNPTTSTTTASSTSSTAPAQTTTSTSTPEGGRPPGNNDFLVPVGFGLSGIFVAAERLKKQFTKGRK